MVKLTESSARPQFDPSLQNLMRLIGKKFQLNNLQLLTVSVLLMRVCRVDKRRGHGFESRLSEQFLTYIGGIAGTGKTMLVWAFLRGLDILGRLDEVLLTAPTGSAAAHIGGPTTHAALGVGSFEDGSVTFQSVSKTRQRLAPIKILIIRSMR